MVGVPPAVLPDVPPDDPPSDGVDGPSTALAADGLAMINATDVTATATICFAFDFTASPQTAFVKGTEAHLHACTHKC